MSSDHEFLPGALALVQHQIRNDFEAFSAELRQQFEDGDKAVLFDIIFWCGLCAVLIPQWAAQEFGAGLQRAQECNSYDKAFGTPYAKGKHPGAQARDIED